ncbi:hypothetical protein FBU30_002082 [Linnemannia zychae]|nr:hypothetical protein FBU30_002082 [Linnemannia zychae]
MTAGKIKDLNCGRGHRRLLQLLAGLKDNENDYLRYQAAYVCQELQYIFDGESPLQVVWKYAQVSSDVTNILKIDLKEFLRGVTAFSELSEEVSATLTSRVEESTFETGNLNIFRENTETAINSTNANLDCIKKQSWIQRYQAS